MAVTVSLHAEQSCGCARSDGRFKERHLTLATISFDSLVHVNFFSHSNYLYHFSTLLSLYLRCCLLGSLTSDCTCPATSRLTNRSRHIPELYYRYLQTIPLDLRQTNSGLRCTSHHKGSHNPGVCCCSRIHCLASHCNSHRNTAYQTGKPKNR
jgi:hypothetical protein